MVDNPRTFLIIISSIIIGFSLIGYGSKYFLTLARENNTFTILLNQNLSSDTSSSQSATQNSVKTTTTTTAQGTTKPLDINNNSIKPQVTPNVIVSYKASGFEPQRITIKSGNVVRFINETTGSMWVTGATAPANASINEFNQGRSVGKNGVFDYTFNRKGTFVYYDTNYKTHVGVVSVE